MRNSWQKDPQKSVFPLGRDSSPIITSRNFHLAFETAVVDLHGDYSHWLACGGEGHLLLLQGFRRVPVSSDPEPIQPYFNFDLLGLNTGQFNADSKAGSALEDVDLRTPLDDRIVKIGEMDLGDLVGDLANLALEKSQAKRTGFSAHQPQWMR